MSGPGCAKKVESSLKDVGRVDIDIPTGRVIVHTSLPWSEVQEKIEKTGRKAVLSGFGGKHMICLNSSRFQIYLKSIIIL